MNNETAKTVTTSQKFNNSVSKILKVFSSAGLNEDSKASSFTKLLESALQLKNSMDGEVNDTLSYLNRAMRAFKDLDVAESERVMNLIKNLYLKEQAANSTLAPAMPDRLRLSTPA